MVQLIFKIISSMIRHKFKTQSFQEMTRFLSRHDWNHWEKLLVELHSQEYRLVHNSQIIKHHIARYGTQDVSK